MAACFYCGGILKLVHKGLYKCLECGLYQPVRQDGRTGILRMGVFDYKDVIDERVQKAPYDQSIGIVIKPAAEEAVDEALSADIITFIRRLTERLTPAVGYSSDVTKDILETRAEYRSQLYEVMEGKRDFQDWFDKTKTRTGLHRQTFMQYIYEALEGLEDPDAVALREGYEQALQGGII